ncbi:MAG TPA: hypothetical protein VNR60_11875 [Croceibacterium sp.]|nr:hypothetical protein [Croceibacterium sp.]
MITTLANVVVKVDANRAHSFAPGDGRFTAAAALQSFSANPETELSSDQARLAILALKQDATAVDALNVLALQAQLRMQSGAVDQLFGYSFALSRRELQPQIWTIEKAVERGDIEQALDSYDLALKISRRAQRDLFPVLSFAIAEPVIREMLLRRLAEKPVWAAAFLNYLSAQGRDPLATANLLQARSISAQVRPAHRAQVINTLVAKNLIDEAWDFYKSYRPDAARDRSRDQDFDMAVEAPSAFDWVVGRSAGLSASISSDANGGFLDFAVPASTRAVVVSQTQLLPSGRYLLEGTSAGIDQADRSQPYWLLACRNGPEIGRVNVTNSSEMNGHFSGDFNVPSDCAIQTLSLILRSSDKASGVSGQVERVQLTPVRK